MLFGMTEPVKSTWTFWWRSSAESVAVTDGEHLAELLDEATTIGSRDRAMAELTSPRGARMTIGLDGESESVATFCESYENPPYFLSHGRREDAVGTVMFFFEGHWTEFDRKAVISRTEAVEAMREFFATEAIPTSIAWADV
jgi:hypothetical protein